MTRKSLLAAALLMASSALMAQKTCVKINSYDNNLIEAYDGQTKTVTMTRLMFNGWNTLCLPVALTAEEVKAAFGDDCKLEALASVTASGSTYYLNFKSTSEVKANTPYILYYNKETSYAQIRAEESTIEYVKEPKQTINIGNATISFVGTTQETRPVGMYGIYAKDNAETKFVKIEDNTNTRFLATRCYITVSGVADPTLIATHNASQAKSSGSSRLTVNVSENTSNDTYTINGTKVNGTANGITITNGKKYGK